MIRRPPRSTPLYSSAASDVYKRQVIVESPTKAKTIRRFLPPNYEVLASMGHVRDLPKGAAEIPASVKKGKWSRIGVNTTEDFEPLYIVPKEKKKVVKDLKNALKDATQLLLCLLYTSPSPRDLSTSRMPSSA